MIVAINGTKTEALSPTAEATTFCLPQNKNVSLRPFSLYVWLCTTGSHQSATSPFLVFISTIMYRCEPFSPSLLERERRRQNKQG